MIAKAKAVKGSKAGARYKELEEKDSLFLFQNDMIGENWKERYEELRATADLYTGSRLEKPFIENVISPSKEVGSFITEEGLRELAQNYADKMGYSDNKWYAIAHRNTDDIHIHMIVCRVNMRGVCSIENYKIGERSGQVATKIAKEKGWRTAQEISAEKKKNIEQSLLSCIRESDDWENVKRKMRERDYHLELSYKSDGSLNGARIIPISELGHNGSESEIEKISKKGYKLSEINRKLKILDLDKHLKLNRLNVETNEERTIRMRR